MTKAPKLTIVLCTRLHDGISGGGTVLAIAKWNAGPINARRAEKALHAEQVENRKNYGNIGCGHSWLELREGSIRHPVHGEGVEADVATAQARGLAYLVARDAECEATLALSDAAYDAALAARYTEST